MPPPPPARGGRPSPPPSSGLRAVVERRSRVLLVYLSQRPPWILPLVTAVLLVAGLFSPPVVGVPLLVAVLLLIGWLSYLSWPAVDGRGRVLRSITLALLVVAVVQKLG